MLRKGAHENKRAARINKGAARIVPCANLSATLPSSSIALTIAADADSLSVGCAAEAAVSLPLPALQPSPRLVLVPAVPLPAAPTRVTRPTRALNVGKCDCCFGASAQRPRSHCQHNASPHCEPQLTWALGLQLSQRAECNRSFSFDDDASGQRAGRVCGAPVAVYTCAVQLAVAMIVASPALGACRARTHAGRGHLKLPVRHIISKERGGGTKLQQARRRGATCGAGGGGRRVKLQCQRPWRRRMCRWERRKPGKP